MDFQGYCTAFTLVRAAGRRPGAQQRRRRARAADAAERRAFQPRKSHKRAVRKLGPQEIVSSWNRDLASVGGARDAR